MQERPTARSLSCLFSVTRLCIGELPAMQLRQSPKSGTEPRHAPRRAVRPRAGSCCRPSSSTRACQSGSATSSRSFSPSAGLASPAPMPASPSSPRASGSASEAASRLGCARGVSPRRNVFLLWVARQEHAFLHRTCRSRPGCRSADGRGGGCCLLLGALGDTSTPPARAGMSGPGCHHGCHRLGGHVASEWRLEWLGG